MAPGTHPPTKVLPNPTGPGDLNPTRNPSAVKFQLFWSQRSGTRGSPHGPFAILPTGCLIEGHIS
jgi:hypothetical protein